MPYPSKNCEPAITAAIKRELVEHGGAAKSKTLSGVAAVLWSGSLLFELRPLGAMSKTYRWPGLPKRGEFPMHSKRSKNITRAQARRFEIITREIGCVCCRQYTGKYRPAEANHLLRGYRLGHDHVTPECEWHHRGIPPNGCEVHVARHTLGPSRALDGKHFREVFGTDAELLAYTNELVEEFEAKIVGGG